jgi:hypothetical protein
MVRVRSNPSNAAVPQTAMLTFTTLWDRMTLNYGFRP